MAGARYPAAMAGHGADPAALVERGQILAWLNLGDVGMTSSTHRLTDSDRFLRPILTLWTVFLLGTVFHTQLALIPLFHGLDVLAPHGHIATDIQEITGILWGMLAFFLLPMVAMIGVSLTQDRWLRVAHFWMTVLYSGLNLAHLGVDLTIPPVAWYQIALMAFLLLIGLLLNLVAYQWVRAAQSQAYRQPVA